MSVRGCSNGPLLPAGQRGEDGGVGEHPGEGSPRRWVVRLDCRTTLQGQSRRDLEDSHRVQGVVKHVSAVGLSKQNLRNAVIISRKEKRDAQGL